MEDYQHHNWRSFSRNNDRRGGRNTFRNSYQYSNSQNRDSMDEKVVIHINSDKVGKLIGKNGSNIKKFQDETTTKIRIERSDGNETTQVTILGSKEAQQAAKDLIEEFLNDYPQSLPKAEYKETERSNEQPKVDFATFDWSKANKECDQYQKEKWESYPPVIKNFYKEHPTVANMTKEQVTYIREQNNNIQVKFVFDSKENEELSIPNPVETFEQAFESYPEILEQIRNQEFDKPSPIQCQAWPILLSGNDMIGIAQTGTGKTLAFLLPALIHIKGQVTPMSERDGPNVLVLAPTRELALQIEKEVKKYSYHNITAVCLYGGGKWKNQVDIVTKGIQIVVATPGRLNALIESNVLNISSVTYLVLDEADRMLDMGFEPQVKKILLGVRPDRQTVMTSATWPQGVRRLAQSYMKSPMQVFVGSLDLATVHTVKQTIYFVKEEQKKDLMYKLFESITPTDKVIVFFGKKTKVNDVASDLALDGIHCQSIHGGREQSDREQALDDLKTGEVQILLATDVASRGIDIEDITHVLNYDFPRDIEDYVHRVGRTGRAGKSGESITFMMERDFSHAQSLIAILKDANQDIPAELYRLADWYCAYSLKPSFMPKANRYRNNY